MTPSAQMVQRSFSSPEDYQRQAVVGSFFFPIELLRQSRTWAKVFLLQQTTYQFSVSFITYVLSA